MAFASPLGKSLHSSGLFFLCTVCQFSEIYGFCVCNPEIGPPLPGLCVRIGHGSKDVGATWGLCTAHTCSHTQRMLGRFQTSSRPTFPTAAFEVPLSHDAGRRAARTEPTRHVKGPIMVLTFSTLSSQDGPCKCVSHHFLSVWSPTTHSPHSRMGLQSLVTRGGRLVLNGSQEQGFQD